MGTLHYLVGVHHQINEAEAEVVVHRQRNAVHRGLAPDRRPSQTHPVVITSCFKHQCFITPFVIEPVRKKKKKKKEVTSSLRTPYSSHSHVDSQKKKKSKKKKKKKKASTSSSASDSDSDSDSDSASASVRFHTSMVSFIDTHPRVQGTGDGRGGEGPACTSGTGRGQRDEAKHQRWKYHLMIF